MSEHDIEQTGAPEEVSVEIAEAPADATPETDVDAAPEAVDENQDGDSPVRKL